MIFLKDIESNLRVYNDQLDYYQVEMSLAIDGELVIDRMQSRYMDGAHCFLGVEQIVRSYMELNSLSVATIVGDFLKFETETDTYAATFSYEVLYTAGPIRYSGAITADALVSANFLTPHKEALLYANCMITLTYFASTEYAVPQITTYMRDGSSTTAAGSYVSGLGTINIRYQSDAYKVDVVFGSRKFTVLMAGDEPYEEFTFLNFYNVQERVFLPCSLERNPSTEFDMGIQSKVAIPYDIEHKVELTVKSSPIVGAVADQLLNLCRSRKVNYIDRYGSASWPCPIIITDYSLPRSTEPNTPIVFEMTFEFADTQLNNTLTLKNG